MISRFCVLLAATAIAAGAGCRRPGGKPRDGGRPDTPADFPGGGGAGSNGSTATGMGGSAGVASGASGGGSSGAGRPGVSGMSGSAAGASGGTSGLAAPLFPCIEDWPSRPAGVERATSLAVAPRTLWTKALPSATAAASIARGMAVTGSGVAFASGNTLLLYGAEGNLIASVAKPQMALMSSPIAGPDGSIYFADSMATYRVDGLGRPIWEKPLGAKQTSGEHAAPRSPALDPAGRLHVSALDGNLWTFRAEDGEVLSSVNIGLWQNGPRYINIGFGKILVVDRSGIAAAGPGTGAYGFMSADQGSWVGEVTGDGLYVIGGYDIGVLVARGSEPSEVSIYDKCGNFRWRVPGNYVVPLAITFDDDLIVMDRMPTGAPSPNDYAFALRRFSKDGSLRAGPVPVAEQFSGTSGVGADATIYYTTWSAAENRLIAFDSSLNQLWSIPFPFCPDAAVLAEGGKIFAARMGPGLAAVQTTSPGPARVSWGQTGRDARATRWLGP